MFALRKPDVEVDRFRFGRRDFFAEGLACHRQTRSGNGQGFATGKTVKRALDRWRFAGERHLDLFWIASQFKAILYPPLRRGLVHRLKLSFPVTAFR